MVIALIVIFLIIPGGEPKISVYKARFVPEDMINLVAAAFMVIINDGKGSDRLLGCSIKEFPSAWCELHDLVGGRMKKVEKIRIPADEITELKEGRHHLMFYNVSPEPKDEVSILLKFKKSGTIEFKAPVHPYHG